MEQNTKVGRVINTKALAEAQESQSKVTSGFKCTAKLKLALITEATKLGLSLSEYVEMIIENRHMVLHDSTALQSTG